MAQLLLVGDGDLDKQVIQADKPVVADFLEKGCLPSRLTEPALEDLAGECMDKANSVSLDVEVSPDSAKAD